jgi:hypothetical protein
LTPTPPPGPRPRLAEPATRSPAAVGRSGQGRGTVGTPATVPGPTTSPRPPRTVRSQEPGRGTSKRPPVITAA